MPIYEYICGACGHAFEKLVRNSAVATSATCASCGSANIERQFSLPNVKSENTRAQVMRAAKKRDQSQATERVEAQRAYEKSHDD